MKYTKFEELPIWQESIALVKLIYHTTSQGSWNKDFGLRDQIQRATVSISSNIVEGFEKNNNNEFIRFLRIAKGSTGEARNQLYIALEIKYLPQKEFDTLNEQFLKVANNIGGLISYLEKYRKSQKA